MWKMERMANIIPSEIETLPQTPALDAQRWTAKLASYPGGGMALLVYDRYGQTVFTERVTTKRGAIRIASLLTELDDPR